MISRLVSAHYSFRSSDAMTATPEPPPFTDQGFPGSPIKDILQEEHTVNVDKNRNSFSKQTHSDVHSNMNRGAVTVTTGNEFVEKDHLDTSRVYLRIRSQLVRNCLKIIYGS